MSENWSMRDLKEALAQVARESSVVEKLEAVYLCGPMTGIEDLNYPAFRRVAGLLRETGIRVYDPSEWEDRHAKGVFLPRLAFEHYLGFICREADAVVVLDGWERSSGARAEVSVALRLGLPILKATEQGGGAGVRPFAVALTVLDVNFDVWASTGARGE